MNSLGNIFADQLIIPVDDRSIAVFDSKVQPWLNQAVDNWFSDTEDQNPFKQYFLQACKECVKQLTPGKPLDNKKIDYLAETWLEVCVEDQKSLKEAHDESVLEAQLRGQYEEGSPEWDACHFDDGY